MKSETLGLHLGIGIFKNPSGDTNMLPEWTTAFFRKDTLSPARVIIS